ncbi:unnamed protein product [Phaeothamnion confervicola]
MTSKTPPPSAGELRVAGLAFAVPDAWFTFQKTTFVYDADKRKAFRRLDYPTACAFDAYLSAPGYATAAALAAAEARWGPNFLEIPSRGFLDLLHEQAVAPFFVFQTVCIGLWILDEYWYYSVFTLLMLVAFESTVCLQRQDSLETLRQMRRPPHAIFAFRLGAWRLVSTAQLVPGDIVSLVEAAAAAAAAAAAMNCWCRATCCCCAGRAWSTRPC